MIKLFIFLAIMKTVFYGKSLFNMIMTNCYLLRFSAGKNNEQFSLLYSKKKTSPTSVGL